MVEHSECRHPQKRIGHRARARAGADLDEALRAHTSNAAWQQKRDHDIGSIEPGKLADLSLVNTDPYLVDPARLQDTMEFQGTWISGRRVDLDRFMTSVGEVAHHHDDALRAGSRPHRC